MAGANTIFSTTLQTLRKRKGVTQEQLANFLGVSPQAVSKWENGSYPEGDLLPRISEFFGVSISYLYGQEKESVSLEQSFLNELIALHEKHEEDKCFERMLELCWSFQIGCWKNNKFYYDRGTPDEDNKTASVYTEDNGFSYFNLNKNKEFYLICKEPKEGFAKSLEITEELRKSFEIMGRKGAIEILEYMMSLKWGEYVTVSTIAKNTGLTEETTKSLLEEMGRLHVHPNALFMKIEIIGVDKKEYAYGVNMSALCLYIPLLWLADLVINPPTGFHLQVNSRGKSFLNRDDVLQNIKNKEVK